MGEWLDGQVNDYGWTLCFQALSRQITAWIFEV